jgi:hypothetical protein
VSRAIDVAANLICPICDVRGEIEVRGNRRCYGVGVFLVEEAGENSYFSPDGWNEGEADFDEVHCGACENEITGSDHDRLLAQAKRAARAVR